MLTSPCCDCETNPTTCNMPAIASQASIEVHPKGDISLDFKRYKEEEAVRCLQL